MGCCQLQRQSVQPQAYGRAMAPAVTECPPSPHYTYEQHRSSRLFLYGISSDYTSLVEKGLGQGGLLSSMTCHYGTDSRNPQSLFQPDDQSSFSDDWQTEDIFGSDCEICPAPSYCPPADRLPYKRSVETRQWYLNRLCYCRGSYSKNKSVLRWQNPAFMPATSYYTIDVGVCPDCDGHFGHSGFLRSMPYPRRSQPSDSTYRWTRTHQAELISYHPQLRHTIVCASSNDVLFTSRRHIVNIHPATNTRRKIVQLYGSPTSDIVENLDSPLQITSMAKSGNALVYGSWDAKYSIVDLTASSPPNEAAFVPLRHALPAPSTPLLPQDDFQIQIINHIAPYASRTTSTPHVIISSNAGFTHTLDCSSNIFTRSTSYPSATSAGIPVNATACSPDGNLLLVAGDIPPTGGPQIVSAASGKVQGTALTYPLSATGPPVPWSFHCAAWSPDGRHTAASTDDGHIVIHDTRNFSRPLRILRLRSPATCLRFAPDKAAGALAVGEAEGRVTIFDSASFSASTEDLMDESLGSQTLDFSGHTAGLDFDAHSGDLYVGVVGPGEGKMGGSGIMAFERRAEAWVYGCALPGMTNHGLDAAKDKEARLEFPTTRKRFRESEEPTFGSASASTSSGEDDWGMSVDDPQPVDFNTVDDSGRAASHEARMDFDIDMDYQDTDVARRKRWEQRRADARAWRAQGRMRRRALMRHLYGRKSY